LAPTEAVSEFSAAQKDEGGIAGVGGARQPEAIATSTYAAAVEGRVVLVVLRRRENNKIGVKTEASFSLWRSLLSQVSSPRSVNVCTVSLARPVGLRLTALSGAGPHLDGRQEGGGTFFLFFGGLFGDIIFWRKAFETPLKRFCPFKENPLPINGETPVRHGENPARSEVRLTEKKTRFGAGRVFS
jgi:hypothetical protein